MSKFFVEKNQINQSHIEILDKDAYHISNVLRCKIGETVTVSSENSLDYICKISKFEKDKVILNIIDCVGNITEPNLKITLYQALPKSDKMDFIIQKCVEIGVDTIVPIKTDRCIVKLDGKENKKLDRWNKISESAAKQSQRGKIPKVKNLLSFKEALIDVKNLDSAIIPYENEKLNSIKNFARNFKGESKSESESVGIFIGPEGGFTENEINLAIQSNVLPVTLGNRILRTETAGIFTSIILLYEMED